VRTTMRFISLLLLVVGLSASGFATDTTMTAKPAVPPTLHKQTICPVMGKAIDSTVYTDIQGQRVYFCCGSCEKKLKADPDKYFKQAATEGVLFQNIQKTCPISGETLEDRTVFSDYEGRRVYFCCGKCKDKFTANPQEYLKKMDTPAKDEKAATEMHGEEGHH
jgi:YHS domain-containing protein